MYRRQFLKLAAGGAAARYVPQSRAASMPARGPIRAIAFDGFPIFDPRPVFALGERLFPGRGTELANAWRMRQFEYQWLRALAGRYADFRQATEEALVFAAKQLRLDLTAARREALMAGYSKLSAWPEVPQALRALHGAGLRLALLSNMTAEMLTAGIANAGLDGLFEHVITTDDIRSYKPDPRAYTQGTDAFGLDRSEILFAAFAGWDAFGAKSFGYPTFWVNRLGVPEEALGYPADASGPDLFALLDHLGIAA